VNIEGQESAHVLDAAKLTCPYCGGPEIMLTSLMDDPNDITNDTRFAALKITFASGTSCQGLVGLCAQCGHEWVPYWWLIDVGESNGTTITMTNLDQITTASLLKGAYMIYLGADANDHYQYFTIDTNTVAAPTVITTVVAPHLDTDGIFLITNILPIGFDAAA